MKTMLDLFVSLSGIHSFQANQTCWDESLACQWWHLTPNPTCLSISGRISLESQLDHWGKLCSGFVGQFSLYHGRLYLFLIYHHKKMGRMKPNDRQIVDIHYTFVTYTSQGLGQFEIILSSLVADAYRRSICVCSCVRSFNATTW